MVSTAAISGQSNADFSFWLANSPSGNPELWLWINGICCLIALFLFLELTLLEVGIMEVLAYGVPLYAMYSFTTTAIWCLESILSLWYSLVVPRNNKSPKGHVVEVLVHAILVLAAVYFLVTSILFFRDMATLPPDELDENKLDVFIDFVIYLLAVLYVFWERRNQQREDEDQSPENVTTYQSFQIV